MALIKCKHCEGTVSDKANICPHCGKSLDENESNPKLEVEDTPQSENTDSQNTNKNNLFMSPILWGGVALLIIVGILIVWLIYKPANAEDNTASDSKSQELCDETVESSVKQGIDDEDLSTNHPIEITDFLQMERLYYKNDTGRLIEYEIPSFRDAEFIVDAITYKGFEPTKTCYLDEIVEGGETETHCIKIFKKFDSDGNWVQIEVEDFFCGHYEIQFVKVNEYDLFIESCKKLGYINDVDNPNHLYPNMIFNGIDLSNQFLYYDNGECGIDLNPSELRVTINKGCM